MKSREKILRLLSENNTLTTATHASVGGGERTQKKDKSCDLSCLVEQTIEFSNSVLDGFAAIVDFLKASQITSKK